MYGVYTGDVWSMYGVCMEYVWIILPADKVNYGKGFLNEF